MEGGRRHQGKEKRRKEGRRGREAIRLRKRVMGKMGEG
jgi:hypothetical protein